MFLRRTGRLSKGRKRLLLAGAALSLVAAGAGLYWHHRPPRSGLSYLEEAEREIKSGQLEEAVIALRNATRAIPDNPGIRLRVAEVYLELNRLAAAEAWARLARQTGADETKVDPILAMAMLEQSKLSALIKSVGPGWRDPPAEADVRVSLALAHIYLGDLHVGEQLLGDARLRDPKTKRLPIGLARLALAKGDLAGARAQLAAAEAADPGTLEMLRLKSDVLRASGDTAGALAELTTALKKYPDDLATLVARADILIATNRLDDAQKDVDHALHVAPESLTPNFLRALLVARRGDFVKADELVMAMSQYFTTMPAGYYLQGIVKYELHQYPLATDSLMRYLGRHPGDAGALRLLALISLAQGDFRHAIELLQPVAAADPGDSTTVGVLARAYLGDGRKDAAVALYEKAAAAHPHDARSQTTAALMQVRYGDANAGFAALESIAGTNTGLELAGPVVAFNALRTGDVAKAAALVDALMQRDPNSAVNRNLLGAVRLAQFKFDDAVKIFASVMETDPDFLTARRNLARAYLAMNRPADAQRVYEALLRRAPKDLPAFYALADLAAAAHDTDQAATRLRQAIAAAPDNPEPGYRLAQLYAHAKDWPHAQAEAHQLVARFPRDAQVVDLAASIRVETGDTAGAVAAFRPLTQWFPRSSGLLQRYAEYQRKAGDIEGARKSLQQAVLLDPANRPIMADLVDLDFASRGADAALATAQSFAATAPVTAGLLAAGVLERAGHRDQAIAALNEAQTRHPDTELAVRLAELTDRSGARAAARQMLQAWLDQHPEAQPARMALANLAMLDQDDDAARRLYEQALERSPDNVIALNNLAWLYDRAHDPRAAALAQRAFRLAPDGVTADTLGWTMLTNGDARGALPFLETAGAARPKDKTVQYHLALAFEATGDKRQARSLLERVVAAGGPFDDMADAKRRLDRLKQE